MAKKVTQNDIKNFIQLYDELGSYAAVARETGFSATTVGKYIKENKTLYSKPTKEPIRFNSFEKIDEIDKRLIELDNWSILCELTDNEVNEVKEIWEEM